jgi:hypothetical protein
MCKDAHRRDAEERRDYAELRFIALKIWIS